MDLGTAEGAANLVNVLTLDCSVCKNASAVGDLFWDEIPFGPRYNLFCACDASPQRGITFESGAADFTAAFVMANQIAAHSVGGKLSFDELVLLPSESSRNGSMGSASVPSLNATSTYGAVSMNGMIAEKATSHSFHVSLSSMAGDVKGLFTGGALNGTYHVSTAEGGIGHVGIVIDDTPTNKRKGRLGKGGASVRIQNYYGNVALSLSTKAPSIFDAITGGLTSGHPSASLSATGNGRGMCVGDGRRSEDLPAEWTWLDPKASISWSSGAHTDVMMVRADLPK